MDKYSRAQQSVGLNHLSIPKLQWSNFVMTSSYHGYKMTDSMIANIPCTIQIILTSVILAILFIVEEKFRNISEKNTGLFKTNTVKVTILQCIPLYMRLWYRQN